MSEMAEARAGLTGADLRRLGISAPLMSDFELAGAVARDQRWDDQVSGNEHLDMAAYDRRGLLNVIAALASEPLP